MREEFRESFLESICEVCKGAHKTSQHDDEYSRKKEYKNLTCSICGGLHKTSFHDAKRFPEEKKNKIE